MPIPERKDVPAADRWDLKALYTDNQAWEEDFKKYQTLFPRLKDWEGRLGSNLETLLEALKFGFDLDLLEERLGEFAQLRVSENLADSEAQERMGRLMSAGTQKAATGSYFSPELMAIPEETIRAWLQDSRLEDYRIFLEKALRYRPHILSGEGETLLALASESEATASKAFSNLTNTDMAFGSLATPEGELPLTQTTYSLFLQNPDKTVRRRAFDQFYAEFQAHENTLSALYAGSVLQDVFHARARNYPSSRDRALFPDRVPGRVYDSLIAGVRRGLPALHRYYALKRRTLGLEKLHHSDVYAPLVGAVQVKHTYDQACAVILEALAPLGSEYVETLRKGLTGGWVDRYENKGKRSGAFSSGSYSGPPYILMNFKDEDLRDVFTLAHEAGHSMHSWYSARSNPFPQWGYTIFEAEVASTFNEQLLGRHLLKTTQDPKVRSFILNKMIDDTVATLFRQTMFAEFEDLVHKQAEAGQGLTLDSLKETYRGLLDAYFGPEVQLEEVSSLECLRIPHFYRAFYVYKYATGISASIALAQRVLEGGEKERQDYFGFLTSGGSRYPAESLAVAGVDVTRPEVVDQAVAIFENLVLDLEKALNPPA